MDSHLRRQTVSMFRTANWLITSRAGAVTKYSNEYVCVCVCVCVCACLSVREDISRTTRGIFTKLFVRVAYRRGLVIVRQGDEIPIGRGNIGVFLPRWQCIVQYSIWDPYKHDWTDRDAVWDDNSGGS